MEEVVLSASEWAMPNRGEMTRDREVAALFDEHYDGLCRLAYVILGDAHVAEEIVMEALLKTFTARADGASGYLTPLDLTTGEPLREPVRLDGDPVDVATGAGAVWVALRGEDAVARVDPVSVIQEETPTPGT